MSTLAVWAAREAVIATGLGSGGTPALSAGSLDGFAVGALMTGACLLAITAPRRTRRSRRRAPAAGPPVLPATAAPVAVPPPAAVLPAAVLSPAVSPAAAGDFQAGSRLTRLLGDAARELVIPAPSQPAGPSQGQSGGLYRSRHRRADDGLPVVAPKHWRAFDSRPAAPEPRRAVARHAAPAGGRGSRVTGVFPLRPLTSAARN